MKQKSPHTNRGYKVPDDYFANVESSFFDTIKNSDPKEHAILDHPNPSAYKVPDSYFEDLEDRILKRVPPTKTEVIPLFSRKKLIYTTISIAALFVLILSIYKQSNTANSDTINLIETAYLQDYIDNGELELSLFEVEDILLDQNIDISAIDSDALQEESLYQYLEDHIETEYILTE